MRAQEHLFYGRFIMAIYDEHDYIKLIINNNVELAHLLDIPMRYAQSIASQVKNGKQHYIRLNNKYLYVIMVELTELEVAGLYDYDKSKSRRKN